MFRQINAVRLKCLFSLVLLVLFALPALGQSADRAAVTGIVEDSSDARIPDAGVKLINSDTGTESTSKTNGSGTFLLTGVLPGHYTLQIERDGFDTTQLTGITLSVGDNKSVVIRMKVGSAQQTVTVDASGLVINSTDGTVSTVIDRKFVENTPLNGRSFQDLISLAPGVLTQSPQSGSALGDNGDFSINGQRTESNYYSVDGVAANTNPGNGQGFPTSGTGGSLPGSTALGTTQTLISVDGLQEFRALTSTYSAEYGRSPGAQISILTRSGTDSYHGTLFDYLRNTSFDANDWFSDHFGDPISPLHQNDFGGTIGGPVVLPGLYKRANKTFFFVSYEGLRLTQPQAASIMYVPDSFMRDQAAVPLKQILNAFPVQNGLDFGTQAAPNLAEFIAPYSLPSAIDSTSARIDQKIAGNWSAFFRIAYTPSTSDSRALSAVSHLNSRNTAYTLGLDGSLNHTVANALRLGFTDSRTALTTMLDNFGGATPLDLANAMGASGRPNAEPYMIMSFPGIGTSYLNSGNTANAQHQWNLTDSATFSLGSHQVKIGVDYLRIASPLSPYNPLVEAEYLNPASVLANQAYFIPVINTVSGTPIFNDFALFGQDEWRISPKLSASIGLRWEIAPPPTGAGGHDAYTLSGDLGQPNSLNVAPLGTALWHTAWFNFAPRIGLAWRAYTKDGWETVLRGGFGVFFDSSNQVAAGGFAGSSLGFGSENYYLNAALPLTPAQLGSTQPVEPPYSNNTIYAFPAHLQLPYTLEWNASLQQQIGREQSLTLSYVGSNGRRLLQQQVLNLSTLNPTFGSVYVFPSDATSNYQSLQIQFQRQVRHGLQAIASYAWSHSIDFGSTSSETAITRGNSDFDVRSNFSAGLTWELPKTKHDRYTSLLTSNWALDARAIARTGFPITLQGAQLSDPTTGLTYYGNVNIDWTKPLYLHSDSFPGGKILNPAAFSLPVSPDPGNAPRNYVRGFGASQINGAIRRDFPIREALSLQFRAEAFNILNHPNFGYIDPTLTDALFGQATRMLNQSLGTVASQYQQGGPRSLQLALKLTF